LTRVRTRPQGSLELARPVLYENLQSKRPEIERTVLTRVASIAGTERSDNPEYVHGLRAAVSAAIGLGLSAVENGERRAPPVPLAIFGQARLAARYGVDLDAVLHRYFAGHSLLSDFIMREAAQSEISLGISEVNHLVRDQVALFDRLVPAISDEYARETAELLKSPAERRATRVRRLLAGELLDTSEFAYEFGGWHTGLLASGLVDQGLISDLASALDRRVLLVTAREGTVWAWLGGRERLDSAEVARAASSIWPSGASLAIGESSRDATGWRLTHEQARAALPIAQQGPTSIARYADHALLASMAQDDLLIASLHEIYLAPLAAESDGGSKLRETLRAYFAARGQISSAAADLRISRKTVSSHLSTVEKRLGRSLSSCAPELEAALRLEGQASAATDSSSHG